MALYDSADLLARTRRLAEMQVPAEYPSDPDWYGWLTEAQDYWTGIIAQHAPRLLCGAPVQLTSADGGYTYTFPTVPVAVEELTIGPAGTTFRLGANYDPTVDGSWEGESTIRIAMGSNRTFSRGLWARYVAQPGVIDESNEPSLPTQCRALLPARACVIYARSGGTRNPAPYLDEETRLWSGDPAMLGDTGILGKIKKKAFTQASSDGFTPWWRLGVAG